MSDDPPRDRPKLRVIEGDPSMAETLEAMLERVRNGEITGVAVAYTTSEGGAGYSWSGSPSKAALAGSIGNMWFEFNRHWE